MNKPKPEGTAQPLNQTKPQDSSNPNSELLKEYFPDAHGLMTHQIKKIETILDNCDVVLDTNALLLPYGAHKNSIDAIKVVFDKLSSKGRLFIPARVAREFTTHRAQKIHDLLKRVSDYESRINCPSGIDLPALSSIQTEEIDKKLESLKSAFKSYKEEIVKVKKSIVSWEWDDPVFELYRNSFKEKESVVELVKDYNELRELLTIRYAAKRPPGYKDASKDDAGEGDLIIWLTILQMGMERRNNLIFVTGEEKTDWVHRLGELIFLPRIELVDEYKMATQGKDFYLVSLSRLLELFNVEEVAVNDIKEQELITKTENISTQTNESDLGFYEDHNQIPTLQFVMRKNKNLVIHGNRRPYGPLNEMEFSSLINFFSSKFHHIPQDLQRFSMVGSISTSLACVITVGEFCAINNLEHGLFYEDEKRFENEIKTKYGDAVLPSFIR